MASSHAVSCAVVTFLRCGTKPGYPCVLQVVARMAKSANDRHWHGAVPVLIAAVALAVMPMFMSRMAWAAFACLSIGAFGIWAGHGPLMSWPAAFLSGTNAASGELPINNNTLLFCALLVLP